MEIQTTFDVPLPPAQAWTELMDIERIAPCMPGAVLTERIDSETYKGKISVRLGPVSLSFDGVIKFLELDATAFRAKVSAQGADAKGRGGAQALTTFKIEEAPAGSRVIVTTDLVLNGSVAQYGRGVGIIQTTANQIVKQFADRLKQQIVSETRAPGAIRSKDNTPAKPISGLSLGYQVVKESILRRTRGS